MNSKTGAYAALNVLDGTLQALFDVCADDNDNAIDVDPYKIDYVGQWDKVDEHLKEMPNDNQARAFIGKKNLTVRHFLLGMKQGVRMERVNALFMQMHPDVVSVPEAQRKRLREIAAGCDDVHLLKWGAKCSTTPLEWHNLFHTCIQYNAVDAMQQLSEQRRKWIPYVRFGRKKKKSDKHGPYLAETSLIVKAAKLERPACLTFLLNALSTTDQTPTGLLCTVYRHVYGSLVIFPQKEDVTRAVYAACKHENPITFLTICKCERPDIQAVITEARPQEWSLPVAIEYANRYPMVSGIATRTLATIHDDPDTISSVVAAICKNFPKDGHRPVLMKDVFAWALSGEHADLSTALMEHVENKESMYHSIISANNVAMLEKLFKLCPETVHVSLPGRVTYTLDIMNALIKHKINFDETFPFVEMASCKFWENQKLVKLITSEHGMTTDKINSCLEIVKYKHLNAVWAGLMKAGFIPRFSETSMNTLYTMGLSSKASRLLLAVHGIDIPFSAFVSMLQIALGNINVNGLNQIDDLVNKFIAEKHTRDEVGQDSMNLIYAHMATLGVRQTAMFETVIRAGWLLFTQEDFLKFISRYRLSLESTKLVVDAHTTWKVPPAKRPAPPATESQPIKRSKQ